MCDCNIMVKYDFMLCLSLQLFFALFMALASNAEISITNKNNNKHKCLFYKSQ